MNRLIDENERPYALVVLEDGTVFTGISCGAPGEVFGELVLSAETFAYQALIEDISNTDKILAFTYPQMGNHGIIAPKPDNQALAASAVLVHDMVYTPSNWQCECSLPDYLTKHDVVAVEDIDMRALTLHVRSANHPLKLAISTTTTNADELLSRLRSAIERGE